MVSIYVDMISTSSAWLLDLETINTSGGMLTWMYQGVHTNSARLTDPELIVSLECELTTNIHMHIIAQPVYVQLPFKRSY